MRLTGPRKNDVALALGAVAFCTSIGLATYLRGISILGPDHQRFVDIIARLRIDVGYGSFQQDLDGYRVMVQQAMTPDETQFMAQHLLNAEPMVMMVIGVAAIAAGGSIAVIKGIERLNMVDAEKLEAKGKWATSVPLLASIFLIGGSAMIAWGFGIYIYACGEVVQPSGATIEAIAISAGVIGAVALACFIADYALNKDKAPVIQSI